MFCEKCRREIDSNAKFCPHCGKKVKIKKVKQKKPISIKIKLIAALCVTICICVAGFVYVQRAHKELDTFEQNIYSAYADLSEIRAYIRKSKMISEDTLFKPVYYCRYYEADDGILVQYKRHWDDEGYSYLLFGYDTDLLDFYSNRYSEEYKLPYQAEVYEEEYTNQIRGTKIYSLVFTRYNGEQFNQYIVCDKYDHIIRMVTNETIVDNQTGVILTYNKQHELVRTRRCIVDSSRVEEFLTCSDTSSFEETWDDVFEYECDSDGKLTQLKCGNITDDNFEYDHYYLFHYDEEGNRDIAEEYEDGKLIASVEYIRSSDERMLEGIVNRVTQYRYDDEQQIISKEVYGIEYLSDGHQFIHYIEDESVYESFSDDESAYETYSDNEYIIGLVTSNNYADYTYRESIEALCSRTNFGGNFSNYRVERSDYVDEFYDLAVRLIDDYGCNVLILEGSNTDDVRYQLENDFDIEVYTVYYDNGDVYNEEEGDNNQETIEESDEAEEVEEETTEEEEPQEQTGGSDWFGWFNNFSIEGKWKNVGSGTFGQAQSGAIVTFTETHCNLYSPVDTYAFYEDNGAYVLDCTSPLGETVTFSVSVTDNDNIQIRYGSSVLEMKRVG